MTELAADRIPVTVTCRVRGLARQPYYRWLAAPIRPSEVAWAYRANALLDAHPDDPEFGHRLLADEARDAGEAMADRTAWRIASENGWWSAFGKKRDRNGTKPGPAVHDDLCTITDENGRIRHEFTAPGANLLWLTDIPPPGASGGRCPHRAQDRRGQALPLRDQGRVLEPDRRLLDRLPHEVETGRERAGERRNDARWRRRLRCSQRSRISISKPEVPARSCRSSHGRING